LKVSLGREYLAGLIHKEDSMAAQNLTDDTKKRSAWSIFMGVLTALLGVFLIIYPMATATITTLLLGWVLIFVAIAQIVFALHSQTVGKFFLKVLLAAIYGIAGVALAFFPIAGVAALTVLLGTLICAYGVVAIVGAFQMRPADGWGWFLFDGLVTLLLGILILARWPSSSLWAIGTLVGVAVLMGGISRVMIAGKLRKAAGIVGDDVRRAA
jgi:uncharacterized membrane protein HdeD (DUF308 family)